VTLTVTGLPSNFTSSFAPTSVIPGSGGAISLLSIQTYANLVRLEERKQRNEAYASVAFGLLLLPLLGIGGIRKRIPRVVVVLLFALSSLSLAAPMMGCGGGYFGPAPASYTLVVTGTSGTLQHSTTVVLHVN
jgi:hypothetical protein